MNALAVCDKFVARKGWTYIITVCRKKGNKKKASTASAALDEGLSVESEVDVSCVVAGDECESISLTKEQEKKEKERIAQLPVFGPYDREIPGTVPQYDFQLFRVPGVHLPEGVVAECPTNLFLLFFTLT